MGVLPRQQRWPILRDTLIPAFIEFKTKGLEKVAWVVENVVTPAFKALTELLDGHSLPLIVRDTLIAGDKGVCRTRSCRSQLKGVIEDTVLPALENLGQAFFERRYRRQSPFR